MKKIKILLLIFPLVMAAACTVDDTGYHDGDASYLNTDDIIPGRIVVKLSEDFEDLSFGISTRGYVETGIPELDILAEMYGATSAERVIPAGGKFDEQHRRYGLHRWYILYFNEQMPMTRAVTDFSSVKEFAVVEFDYVLRKEYEGEVISYNGSDLANTRAETVYPFNDPMLSQQWHYYNDGSLKNSVAGADVSLFDAWTITTGKPEVIVAVMDTGVDCYHEDLLANMWINEAELNGSDGVDDDGNGYVDDIFGYDFVNNTGIITGGIHGTHVAGTVAAVNNNGIGVAGVAGGDGSGNGARLMTCSLALSETSVAGASTLKRAFVYAADNGAVISQNSYSSAASSILLEEGIQYFIETAGIENGVQTGPMAGGIVIAAASNYSSSTQRYPAALSNVVAVGAIAPDYVKANYSNYGSWVNISCPGGQSAIYGKYDEYHQVLSTLPNNDYGFLSGTSMACPHMSGIAALIVSNYGGPGFTPDELLDIIYQSVRDIDRFNAASIKGYMGLGLADAAMALSTNNGTAPSAVGNLTVERDETTATLTWTAPTDQNGFAIFQYEIYYSTREHLEGMSYQNPPSSATKISVYNRTPAGKTVEHTLSGLAENTPYSFAVFAYDSFGNYSPVAANAQITEYPELIKSIPDMTFEDIGQSYARTIDLSSYFKATDYFSEADATGKLKFTVSTTDNSVVSAVLNDTENKLTVTPLANGKTSVTVTSSLPGSSETVSTTFQATVNAATPPTTTYDVKLYPMPVTDIMNIAVSDGISGSCIIRLYNSVGNKVYDRTMTFQPSQVVRIDIGSLTAGIYNFVLANDGKEYKKTVTKL